MRRVRPKPIASIQGAHTIHASPSCVPALQSQSPVALPLDVRPSVPVLFPWREQCSQSRVLGKRAALALSRCLSAGGPDGSRAAGMSWWGGEGPRGPAPFFSPRWLQPCVPPRLQSAPGCPRTLHDLAHTHPRAHAHAVRYFPAPDPASGRGAGAEPRCRGVGGAGDAGVLAPVSRLCAPSPTTFGARG